MRTNSKIIERLTLALNTANSWSSNQGGGRHLLSLGTTRKVHDEEHRAGCLAEIAQDVAWCRWWESQVRMGNVAPPARGEPNGEPIKDVARLEDLATLVADTPPGVEWIEGDQYREASEHLYKKGIY